MSYSDARLSVNGPGLAVLEGTLFTTVEGEPGTSFVSGVYDVKTTSTFSLSFLFTSSGAGTLTYPVGFVGPVVTVTFIKL